MIKAIKRLLRRIQFFLYKWVSKVDMWWAEDTLTMLNLKRDDSMQFNKDGNYWTQVSHVRDNHAFMNELSDLELAVEKRIYAELLAIDKPDLDKLRAMRYQIKGIRNVGSVIKHALDETRGNKNKYMEN